MVPTHMIQPKLCCTQARSGPDNRMPMDAPFRWCIDRHRVTCRLGKHPWPFTNKAPNSRQPNATATELRHESGFSRSPSRPWVFFQAGPGSTTGTFAYRTTSCSGGKKRWVISIHTGLTWMHPGILPSCTPHTQPRSRDRPTGGQPVERGANEQEVAEVPGVVQDPITSATHPADGKNDRHDPHDLF